MTMDARERLELREQQIRTSQKIQQLQATIDKLAADLSKERNAHQSNIEAGIRNCHTRDKRIAELEAAIRAAPCGNMRGKNREVGGWWPCTTTLYSGELDTDPCDCWKRGLGVWDE